MIEFEYELKIFHSRYFSKNATYVSILFSFIILGKQWYSLKLKARGCNSKDVSYKFINTMEFRHSYFVQWWQYIFLTKQTPTFLKMFEKLRNLEFLKIIFDLIRRNSKRRNSEEKKFSNKKGVKKNKKHTCGLCMLFNDMVTMSWIVLISWK